MNIYIAFLRGINVGGKNIIKMADLKKMFEELGFNDVRTYIQSGNVLFKSNEAEGILCKKIECEIEKIFGFPVAVVLRGSEELEQIISSCPFSADEISKAEAASDAESLYVSLLTGIPSQDKISYLDSYKSDFDDYRILGKQVYLLFHNSIRNSKLANNLHKLGVDGTVRNWKTMSKLAAIADSMKG